MLTTRELPPEEWPRLAGTDLAAWLPRMDPGRFTVLVVEDEQGAIVGTWAFLLVLHAEGFWIDPAHRRTGGVVRGLLRAAMDIARERGESWVFTGAEKDDAALDRYIRRLGGQEMPIRSYVLPVRSY